MIKFMCQIIIFVVMLILCSSSFVECFNKWPLRGVAVNSEHFNPDDLIELKAKINIDWVSIQIRPRIRAKLNKISPQQAIIDEFDWAMKVLDSCKANNLLAAVDLYNFPVDYRLGIDQHSPEFWDNDHHLEEVLQIVELMVNKFHHRGKELLCYQVIGEPVVRRGDDYVVPSVWPHFLIKIVDTIRSIDKHRWISVCVGRGMPQDYKNAKPINKNNIIYSAHMYFPHRYTHQGIGNYYLGNKYPGWNSYYYLSKDTLRDALLYLKLFSDRYRVPVWISEFGVARWAYGSEQYIKDIVSIFDEFNFSWTYFVIGGSHIWSPDYNTNYTNSTNFLRIHKDYSGISSSRWQVLQHLFNN